MIFSSNTIGLLSICILVICIPDIASAQQDLQSSGVMNDVMHRFYNAASTWGPAVESAASRLFWSLAMISMVWTFGFMAFRQADLGEFFAEFIRFIIFTGFYWWLLTNATQGAGIANSIIDSMNQLGAQAGSLSSSRLGPSEILDIGFKLYSDTLEITEELGWKKFATEIVMELTAIAVVLVLAIVAINLLIALISSWILMYAGLFFLGFGGARWTSDMALNYYRAIFGVAIQIFTMMLIIAIGKQFINDFQSQIGTDITSQELLVMLVVSSCLLVITNKIPAILAGLVSGGTSSAVGAGPASAGAIVGGAMTAASIAYSTSQMLLDGASNLFKSNKEQDKSENSISQEIIASQQAQQNSTQPPPSFASVSGTANNVSNQSESAFASFNRSQAMFNEQQRKNDFPDLESSDQVEHNESKV